MNLDKRIAQLSPAKLALLEQKLRKDSAGSRPQIISNSTQPKA